MKFLFVEFGLSVNVEVGFVFVFVSCSAHGCGPVVVFNAECYILGVYYVSW